MKAKPSFILAATMLAISAWTTQSSHGQVTNTWRGDGNQAFPTAIWGGIANWVGNTPANGVNNTALFATTFNNGYSCHFNTTRTLGFITFTDPDTVNDHNLIIRLNTTGDNTTLTLSATGQPGFTVTDPGNTMIFQPRILGTQGFAKNGPGRVVLPNPGSTYTGPLAVNAGILEFGGGVFTISKGTDARPASPATFDIDTGTMGRVGNGNYDGAITIAEDALFFYNSDSDTILTGNISGDGALHKGRSGLLTLTGTSTYTGGTTALGGSLLATAPQSLASYDAPGEVVFDGGTIGVRIGGSGWTTTEIDTLLSNATRTAGALGIDTTNGDAAQWIAFDTTYLGSALGITKLGDNTLTLNLANNYTGTTTVRQGTLLLESPATLGSGTNDLILEGGTLDLGGLGMTAEDIAITHASPAGDTLANGSLTGTSYAISNATGNAIVLASLLANGSIGLAKSGAGTATLSGANTYTGDTLATEGTLLGGSGGSSASDVAVATGTAFGAFVTAENGQWTSTGDLTYANDSTIHIEYGSTPPSKTTAPIAVENLTFGTGLTVFIPQNSLALLEVGETYPLMTWSGTGPTDATAITSFIAYRTFADFSVVGDTLFMTITASAPGPIFWNTGDNIWDTTTLNWLDSANNATTYFTTLDTVVFGNVPSVDENEPITVTLNTGTAPIGVLVDSTEHNYTVTGTGALTGSTGLTVNIPSDRTFTLGMANSYTGGTTIQSGTLAMTNNLSLGGNNSVINVANGATLNMNGAKTGNSDYHAFIIGTGVNDVGAVINTTIDRTTGLGRLTLLGDASIGGTNRWDFRPLSAGSGFINLDGHTLTKVGTNKVAVVDLLMSSPGTILINAGRLGFTRCTVSGSGPVIVNSAGTLEFENYSSGSFDKAIEINGGLMHAFGNAPFTTPATIAISGDAKVQSDVAITLNGVVSGTGSLTKLGTNTLNLNAANDYSGSTIISAGSLTLGATGTIDDSPSVSINSGATLNTNAKASYAIPAGQMIEFVVNPAGAGSSGSIQAAALDVSGAAVSFDLLGTLDDPAYVLATYTSLIGSPFASVTLPPGYTIDYSFEGNKIALVESPLDADYNLWASGFPDADLSDPNGDADGDGLTNDQERLFGLDPTNPSSVNPIAVPLDASAGTLSFTRRDPALTGLSNQVWTSTNLANWTLDATAVLTPGATVNDVQTVAVQITPALLSEPRLFVRIGVDVPTPLLSEDFEDGQGGFTVVTTSGTAWQFGTPNSPTQGGGAVLSAKSGTACWGTNLTGGYGPNTITSLQSPVIDLTNITSANLSFALSMDANVGHNLTVNVIDSTNDTHPGNVIATIIPGITDGDDMVSPWESIGPVALPPAAFGQSVRIEWRFVGDGDNFYNGVYIDDVVLTGQ